MTVSPQPQNAAACRTPEKHRKNIGKNSDFNQNVQSMNIEDFRTYCLSFKGAYEKMPFEKAASAYDRNLLVFCVAEK